MRSSELALIRGMIGDAPEPVAPLPILVAADPLDLKRGAHPAALKLLARIRVKGKNAKTRAEANRYRQAHPEVVAEVAAEGPLVSPDEPLGLPSIPPAPGDGPDPALAGIRPPLRSGMMARRATPPSPLDGVGHEGRVQHLSPRDDADRTPWALRDFTGEEQPGPASEG